MQNRIWKSKDHEESARTTILLLQFRIHKNISVCWIINSGRVVHVSAKVVPSTTATMDLVIRSEKPSGHVTNYNTKDPGRRPWKFHARFRRHPVALSFQILDDCLWSSNAYAVEIIISEPWTAFRTSGISADLWTPLQGPPDSLISLLIMYLCKIKTFDKIPFEITWRELTTWLRIVMLLAWQRRNQSPPVSCYKANSVEWLTRHVTISRKQSLCTVVGEGITKNCSLKWSPSSLGMVHRTPCTYEVTLGVCLCVRACLPQMFNYTPNITRKRWYLRDGWPVWCGAGDCWL